MKMKNKRHSFRALAMVLCLALICPCMLAMADDVDAAEDEALEIVETFVITEIDAEEKPVSESSEASEAPADYVAEETPAEEPVITEPEPEPEPETAEDPTDTAEARPADTSEPLGEPDPLDESESTDNSSPFGEPEAETEPEPTSTAEPTNEPDPTTEPMPAETPEPVDEPEPDIEPEPTAEPIPTDEPEPTMEPDPTTEPMPMDEPEPTMEPTPTDVPEPTEAPSPEYELSHSGDDAWANSPVVLQIRIRDLNSSGWTKVAAAIGKDGDRTDLTRELAENGFANYTVDKNCTVHVFITDKEGKEHVEKFSVTCFDYEGPRVTAGIDNTILRVEAVDTQSGVRGIYVNGNLYTTLENGVLNLPASENTTDEAFTITAVDNLGNESKTVTISNPFYKKPASEHSHNCPEDCDCRTSNTPAPTQTPTPIQTPSPAKPGSSGNGGGGGGSQTTPVPTQAPATQTPTPTSASETPAAPKPTPETKTTPEPLVIEPGTPFSESGNFTTRDLLYDKHTNKQFIVVETRNGATFYMVIDYDKPLDEDGERYETFFLNMVDEADLLALLDDGTQKTPVCTCTDKCEPGHVNTACEVCRVNMSECTGREPVNVTPEPTVEPEPEPQPEPEKSSGGSILVVLLLLALAGGALYWFKFRKGKPQAKGPIDLDDYDYGEDDEDDYETEPDDADANETTGEGDKDYE